MNGLQTSTLVKRLARAIDTHVIDRDHAAFVVGQFELEVRTHGIYTQLDFRANGRYVGTQTLTDTASIEWIIELVRNAARNQTESK